MIEKEKQMKTSEPSENAKAATEAEAPPTSLEAPPTTPGSQEDGPQSPQEKDKDKVCGDSH